MAGCRDFDALRMSRRTALRVGGLGLMGLSLPDLLAAADRGRAARARSVILLHQFGGPGQQETFDLKPDAPEGIRGEFKPIATKVPGLYVGERLPHVARVADKFALVRTVRHTMTNHNPAGYYSLTGQAPPSNDIRLPDTPDLFPAYGSVIGRFLPPRNGVPAFVSFPHVLRDGSVTPGQHGGFLGKQYDPLYVGSDPKEPDFGMPELKLPDDLPAERFTDRRTLLKALDRQSAALDRAAGSQGVGPFYQRALNLLTSADLKKAFDLTREPEAVRDRYGRTTYGQSCLLARRLVEAGARFVNVYFSPRIGGDTGGWDMHGFRGQDTSAVLKNHLLPITDQTLPALLTDLDDRGLLDETLVVWMGEFGRTPKINAMKGRDHWAQCYTVLLAGGGVKRGYAHGASDKIGAFAARDPVRLEDLAATLFAAVGLDPATEIRDTFHRPFPIARGTPIADVFA